MADHPSYPAQPGYFDPGGAGHMHAELRASDADREQLVDVLKTAFGEGRLTQDEYTTRMEQAYTAKTYGELRALVADLPGPAVPQVPYTFTRYQQQRPTNSLAVASMVFGFATPLFALTAIPAVILGHKARGEIRRTGERGKGMATTGLVIGWTVIGLVALLATLIVLVAASTHGAATGPTGFQSQGVYLLPDIIKHAGSGPH
ncbi:MAG TPA: DUF1707 and DUF4190 domain-containing protein [Streptosporangiaceae bacterium]|nr:DUF1707 and DUF4190 domain-containing protein [Streptosporangiaceae bacterium]